MMFFNLIPILMEIGFTLLVFAILFDWRFFLLNLVFIVSYLSMTWCITQSRAKQFKDLTLADQNYNQKATDSLLNFETVKYFNAEKHEENRFEIALNAYKK